jgi:GT2 family glycosyltransferase
MSYRRCVFDKVGFFSADVGRVGTVPRGCEETEFGIRALRRFERARLLYVPTARVWHSVSAERTKLGYFTRRCFAEGMSKATVAGSTGVPSALSTEYRYTMRTLPRGVLRGLRAAIGADFGGLRRAGIIVVGLVVTTFGYLTGRVRARLASRALPGITDRGR